MRCAIASNLEQLEQDAQTHVDEAIDAAERTHFRRWAGAYRKALYHWLTGVRAHRTPYGGWVVPSATRGGVVHHVAADGHCTCEAGGLGCWHAGLAMGLEIGEQHEVDIVPPLTDEDRERARRDIDDVFAA